MAAAGGSFPTLMQHARSAAMGPGIFCFLIPALIIYTSKDSPPILGSINNDKGPQWLLPSGVCYLILGAVLMLATNFTFHTEGRGTLAPWDAPKRLVVQGLYRHMRNPMFWGACCMVFGEALVFNSQHLLYYFLVVVAVQMVHVPLNEERWLRRGFGAEYEEYCRHVPRWLPRRTPYEMRSESGET